MFLAISMQHLHHMSTFYHIARIHVNAENANNVGIFKPLLPTRSAFYITIGSFTSLQ